MAPPRRVVCKQLDILINFLEENRDMIQGGVSAGEESLITARNKWTVLAKKLNAVEGGTMKTPEGWKKYWFEWRYKCKKKLTNRRRFLSDAYKGRNRFVPFNDLEIRVLELSGKPVGDIVMGPRVSRVDIDEDYVDDNTCTSDNEEPQDVKLNVSQDKPSTWNPVKSIKETNPKCVSPLPPWLISLEERKIQVDERTADALESIATTIRMQEERRTMIDERTADALTAVAKTLQDLNSGIQEAVRHLQQLHPVQNEWVVKSDIL